MIWILAVDRQWNIGYRGDLLYTLEQDLHRFKEITMGHILLMGRKTFESLPGLLPGREHLVLSRDPHYQAEGIRVFHSKQEVLNYLEKYAGERKVFMIGGGAVARLFLDETTEAMITEVDDVAKKYDTSLPRLDPEDFELIDCSEWQYEKEIRFRYLHYRRKDRA